MQIMNLFFTKMMGMKRVEISLSVNILRFNIQQISYWILSSILLYFKTCFEDIILCTLYDFVVYQRIVILNNCSRSQVSCH